MNGTVTAELRQNKLITKHVNWMGSESTNVGVRCNRFASPPPPKKTPSKYAHVHTRNDCRESIADPLSRMHMFTQCNTYEAPQVLAMLHTHTHTEEY